MSGHVKTSQGPQKHLNTPEGYSRSPLITKSFQIFN